MDDKHSTSEPQRERYLGPWHDRFFKHNFNTEASIWSLLQMALTPEQLATLDPGSIVIKSGSLSDDNNLVEYVSDLIVEIKLSDGSDIALTVIFEHKSYVDPNLLSQLFNYMGQLYRKKARLVVPVVVYHGRSKQGPEPSFYELNYADLSPDIFDAWEPNLVKFRVILLNLRDSQVQARLGLGRLPLRDALSMQVMGQVWEVDESLYISWMDQSNQLEVSERIQFVQMLSIYLTVVIPEIKIQRMRELSEVLGSGDEKMREALLKLWRETQPESVAEFYEIANQKILPEIQRKSLQEGRQKGLQEGRQKGLQEGRQEGLQEGLQKGLQKGRQETIEEVAERLISKGMADSDIHVVTQLSMEEVAKLRNGACE